MAEPFIYTAAELFGWLCGKPDFVLLDVRNEKDFANWYVEGPHLCPYINIPYFDFIEEPDAHIALVPPGEKVRVVCSKEGSAKYVSELLIGGGFTDVGYLQQGIVGWGNGVIPRQVETDGNYELYQCVRPGKASCSYVLISNGEAMVFDPSRNIEVYTQLTESKGAKISRSFETHRQADYISGCQLIKKATGCTIMANRFDFDGAAFEYDAVADGDIYKCGDVEVKAIHTPGHTMGSTCYQIDGKFLLSGDTVFIKTAGRPDLGGKWEEWSRVLYLTLFLKLGKLSDDLVVLPGHYVGWDEANEKLLFAEKLGQLRKQVDAFQIDNEVKFKEFISDNMRQQPGVYAEIRRVNGGWLNPSEEEANTMDLGKNECGASKYGKVGVSSEVMRQASLGG